MNERPWIAQLICCGRDDGRVPFRTWEKADEFRKIYTNGPGVGPNGHERSVIITAASPAEEQS